MEFNNIDNIDYACVQKCKRRFNALTLELGINHNNPHVGSGLGGNNFQLMVLMEFKHQLVNDQNLTISVDNATNTFSWGSIWLSQVSAVDIRKAVDSIFDKMPESKKVLAIAFEALIESNCILDSFEKHKKHFPKLKEYLAGQFWSMPKNLDMKDSLILASIICQKLASELDANNVSNIDNAGAILNELPNEVYLLAVRRYIKIERLIKFSLDDNLVWGPSLSKIQKAAEI